MMNIDKFFNQEITHKSQYWLGWVFGALFGICLITLIDKLFSI